jgi:competence protein ComEA
LAEYLERYRWLIVAILSLPLLGSVALLAEDRLSGSDPPVVRQADPPYYDIRVYVAGAVANPGIYPLEEGARWADAITAAGGFTADANPEAVNLARRVNDEDHIIVPRALTETGGSGSGGNLVNINSASESELVSLPGIGEARAANIVRSRTEDGPFGVPEDLVVRELVPDSVYQDIAGLITVSQ